VCHQVPHRRVDPDARPSWALREPSVTALILIPLSFRRTRVRFVVVRRLARREQKRLAGNVNELVTGEAAGMTTCNGLGKDGGWKATLTPRRCCCWHSSSLVRGACAYSLAVTNGRLAPPRRSAGNRQAAQRSGVSVASYGLVTPPDPERLQRLDACAHGARGCMASAACSGGAMRACVLRTARHAPGWRGNKRWRQGTRVRWE
jgi:hypothetical protein